jgi:hypothetical protein
MGSVPEKFSAYAYPLLQFSRANKFKYPAKPWPADEGKSTLKIAGSAGA